MRLIVLMCMLLALAPVVAFSAPVQAIVSGPIRLCSDHPEGRRCTTVTDRPLTLNRPNTVLMLEVDVPAARRSTPLEVRLDGLASSEVRWNGAVIGRNGVPSNDRASERPGRIEGRFTVPPDLVRVGRNQVTARVSSHHLWLPVRWPLHNFEVRRLGEPMRISEMVYLPALGVMSVFLLSAVVFGLAGFTGAGRAEARTLTVLAGLAALQLAMETLRLFVAYTYPWHLGRVGLIAILAGASAVTMAAYAGRRFAPAWRRTLMYAVAAASLAAILLVPSYDGKAGWSLAAGLLAAFAAGARTIRRRPDAAIATALAGLSLIIWVRDPLFLDRAYYLLLAAAFGVLLGESAWRAAKARPRVATSDGRETVVLRDGARSHVLAADDIVYVRGADDYCEASLADGRKLMASETLARLQQTLPPAFLRIHKSYIVNTRRLEALTPRPGGGRLARLKGGESVPIGRTYEAAVRRWLETEAGGRLRTSGAEAEPA